MSLFAGGHPLSPGLPKPLSLGQDSTAFHGWLHDVCYILSLRYQIACEVIMCQETAALQDCVSLICQVAEEVA